MYVNRNRKEDRREISLVSELLLLLFHSHGVTPIGSTWFDDGSLLVELPHGGRRLERSATSDSAVGDP